MFKNTRPIKILLLGWLCIMQFLIYTPFSYAQITSGPLPLNQNNPTAADLPRYNQGVDQSIKEYLCTPNPSNVGVALYDCVGRLYRFGIAAGAIIIVFFVVYAGYVYISQGEQGKSAAKGYIENCLVGMGLLLGSYVLLNFISPTLTEIRPIQPPIFSATDLPKCEEVGFSVNCIIADGKSPNQGQVVYVGKAGGNCQPAPSGPGSIAALSNSCFAKYGPEVVRQASIVANAESGGTPGLPVGAGSCGVGKPKARCSGGEIPVFGMFQINLAAHKVAGLDCPSAFGNKGFTCNKGCTVTNPTLYNQCVAAIKKIENDIGTACTIYQNNINNKKPGFKDWGNTGNLHYLRCGFK